MIRGLKQPNANGKSATVGFCFGGAQSFRAAINEPALNAAVVYYGQSPTDAPPAARGTPPAPFVPSAAIANIKAPVLGLYGGLVEDAGIGQDDRADRRQDEGARQDLRAAHLRRCGAWISSRADGQ